MELTRTMAIHYIFSTGKTFIPMRGSICNKVPVDVTTTIESAFSNCPILRRCGRRGIRSRVEADSRHRKEYRQKVHSFAGTCQIVTIPGTC
jgi:hypothetical protein